MKIDIVRAWKDEIYRNRLVASGYEVPANPAGAVELSEEDLAKVAGGLQKTLLSGPVDCTDLSHRAGGGCHPAGTENAFGCGTFPPVVSNPGRGR
ncbi:MAG TPA: mersacidin/lichenicidin family type 2 lantibiotic [Ktedonobacterales bacterium]|jgi:mersacidin/lichenicidin family type 2 lantibiotic